MKKENKKKIILIVSVALILIAIILVFAFNFTKRIEEEKIINTYFQNKEDIYAYSDLISEQQTTDKTIKEALKNKDYTFDNPLVLTNPYKISPLTGLVIFQTKDEVEVNVSIRGMKVTTMNKSKEHAIPIYGLKAGENNSVTLEIGNDKKELNFDLTSTTSNNLTVTKTNKERNIDKDLYFFSGSMGTPAAAYDGDGNRVWYFNHRYTLDMEMLPNGHFLLSNDGASTILYGYSGFVEVDYLGKVYKNYFLKNGYHHELVYLNDGTIMIAGDAENHTGTYKEAYVYRINDKGEVLDDLSVYDVFAKVDKDFADSLAGTDMFNNSLDYNEETNELIMSLRGINTIISVNYKTKELNWIFADPKEFPESFDPYLLKVTDSSRYPKGQHTAYYTNDGYLGVFNNDYDPTMTANDLVFFKENYSSAVLYDINKDDKTIKTHWEYDGNHEYFNYALGSLHVDDKGSKLIDFGWTYKKAAYNTPGLKLDDYYGNTYAKVIEIDPSDNVTFEASIEEGIYRVYKHSLYEPTTNNFEVKDYELIDNNEFTKLDKIKTNDITNQLETAEKNPFDFKLTKNTLTINVLFDDEEEVNIYLVGDKNDTYVIPYKKKGTSSPNKFYLDLKGKYAVYLKINDTLYNTNKVLNMD